MTPQCAKEALLLCGDLALKSAVILGLAWVATRTMRRASAAIRHLVWLSAFCMLIALPVLRILTPAASIVLFREPVVTKPAEVHDSFRASVADFAAVASARISAPATAQPPASKPLEKVSGPNLPLVLDLVAAIWLAGLLGVCAQGLWAMFALGRLNRRSLRPDKIADRVDLVSLSRQAELRRRWELRVSRVTQPPAAMTWGLFRPVVLLPKISASWTQERLEAVLLHELAHVRRLDYLSQLIAVVAGALYWFNPTVWLCRRAMRAEAEAAADDSVIRMGFKPSDYARELLQIAADLGPRRQPFANIGVPVMKQSKIETRVKAILDPSARRRRGVTAIEVLATFGLFTAVAVSLSSFQPRIGAVPAEPSLRIVAPQTRVVSPMPTPSPVAAEATLSTNLVAIQAQQKDKDAEIQRLKAEIKALKEKNQGAQLKAQAERLQAQVQQLRAQQAQVKEQLERAKAELMAARDRMESDRQHIQKDLLSQSGAQQKAFAEAQRALREQMKSQQDQLRANAEMMKATQKALMEQQKAAIDAQRAAMAKQMLDMQLQLQHAREQIEKESQKNHDLISDPNSEPVRHRVQVAAHTHLLEASKARLQAAKAEYARKKALFDQGVISQEAMDEAEAAIRNADAEVAMHMAILEALNKK